MTTALLIFAGLGFLGGVCLTSHAFKRAGWTPPNYRKEVV